MIDALSGGNDVRSINHGCDPNCIAVREGDRIHDVACRDILDDVELLIDYKLSTAEPITEELRQLFVCHCGSAACRGTMLKLIRRADE